MTRFTYDDERRYAELLSYEHPSTRQRAELRELTGRREATQRERGAWETAIAREGRMGMRSRSESVSPGLAGYDSEPVPMREVGAAEYSRMASRTPEGAGYHARTVIARLHDREEISDLGALALTRMVSDEDPVEAWRAADMVALLGSEEYEKAFAEAVRGSLRSGPLMLSGQERDLLARGRAMGVGTGAGGGFAVPFQLDPTLMLTSAGAIDPIRKICRSERGTAKEFDLVATLGATAAYAAEGTEASDNSPVLSQPKIIPSRMQGFVPFSIELDASWQAITSELTMVLTDAADVLDAQVHITGSGTAPVPQGIVTGILALGTANANAVTTATTATTTLADLQLLQRTVPPRFRPKSQFIANLSLIQAAQRFELYTGRSAVQGQPGNSGAPLTLLDDPLSEASYMDAAISTTGQHIAVAGDFRAGYCLYDVIPSLVEPVQHLFGAAGRPTGTRGLYMIRYHGSQVVNGAALAMLTVK